MKVYQVKLDGRSPSTGTVYVNATSVQDALDKTKAWITEYQSSFVHLDRPSFVPVITVESVIEVGDLIGGSNGSS